MGLDMYLTKKIYIGAKFKHNKIHGTIDLYQGENKINIDISKLDSVIEGVGYWRKANQIHNWFVKNIQEGNDDCKEYYVPFDKLLELKQLCQKALKTKNSDLLPPLKGFFFGGTEINDWYWDNLKETIKIIDSLSNEGDYYYNAPW